MDNFGFIRVAAASPVVRVADVKANVAEICRIIGEAVDKGIAILAFPELSVTGYSCGDLFANSRLIEAAQEGIEQIRAYTEGLKIAVVVGAPIRRCNKLYDSAVVIMDGKVAGYHDEIFTLGGVSFKAAVGEDPEIDGSAEIIVNISASGETAGKHCARKRLLGSQSERTHSGYVYAASGYGESTQDEVFAGGSMIWENGCLLAENERFQTHSSMIAADIDVELLRSLRADRHFASDRVPSCEPIDLGPAPATDFGAALLREVDPHPFLVKGREDEVDARCREILDMQALGLLTRLDHIHSRKAVLGISGGLDSTLALLVTVLAFDKLGIPRSGILGITMPGLGTSSRTHGNAWALMEKLGITAREIPIAEAIKQHFSDIGHDGATKDTTYENAQARERTQILMDVANAEGGLVVGTGDLSELALGWCTFNGDHMAMYGVNGSIPKTLVRQLCTWASEKLFPEAAETLRDVVATPISPELKKEDPGKISQITEDLIGPYELNDFYLYHFLRFGASPAKIRFLAGKAFAGKNDEATISRWLQNFLRRFLSQQFKRSCLPDGPKVTPVSLSPRGDWRMPSDVKGNSLLDA